MRKPRLLLVNPIQQMGPRRQRGWNGIRFVPPLNLAYVAALTPAHWQIEIVDSGGSVGSSTSLALGVEGRPHLSYFDFTNADLKYARGIEAICWLYLPLVLRAH